ncbi:MAG: septation protein A [Legionellales bacterium]|nr:septation protein A [Legionellales bacterium]
MKLLFDFFPILLFFICYKFWGIYPATGVAMISSLVQVIYYRLMHQRYEKMHLISMGLILILGGATLFFHNPWFIKCKPTGIYWLSALVFFGSAFVSKKPLIQTMMEGNVNLPPKIWGRLNMAWALFFVIMGAANLYVAYHYDTDFWVNFKLFGGAGFTLLFVFLQAIYLTKHIVEVDLIKQTGGSPIKTNP